jgi:hypothetical protein
MEEPEGLLWCSQQPASVPYPGPDEFNPHFTAIFILMGRYLIRLSSTISTVCNETGQIKRDLSPCRARQEPWYLSGITLSYGMDDRGFESQQGLGIFLFTTASRPALGPTQPAFSPIGTRGSFPGAKRPGREADHAPPSSDEVKNA